MAEADTATILATDNKKVHNIHIDEERGCCAPTLNPSAMAQEEQGLVVEEEDEHAYLPERHDPFDETFRTYSVMPLLGFIPAWVSPNAITAFNVPVRIGMQYLAWRQNERPTPFGDWELFGRGDTRVSSIQTP